MFCSIHCYAVVNDCLFSEHLRTPSLHVSLLVYFTPHRKPYYFVLGGEHVKRLFLFLKSTVKCVEFVKYEYAVNTKNSPWFEL